MALINLNEVCEEVHVPDQDAAWDAYYFLKGEGFIIERAMGGIVAITHQGVREIEESIKSPQRGTDHFPPLVIQRVEQHFHAAVGAVQTGAGSVANVQQTVGVDLEGAVRLLQALREHIPSLPPEHQAPATELVDGLEMEARSGQPAPGRVRALATGLQGILVAAGATAAAKLLADLLLTLGS